ncbi:MAG TPA: GDSL-type esterase/lipase family protein [Chitinophagales bacterium]|nr:GDSL-type esterase/lipase family protein [Chitinophagales bacterium]
MKTPSKNTGVAVAAVTGSLLVGLLAGEFLLRMLGVYATYNEKTNGGGYVSQFTTGQKGWLNTYLPDQQLTRSHLEFNHEIRANSIGANDREWPLEKTKPLRIACLGDSFTDGVGAPRDSSYPAQLQTMIDSSEVFNAGIAGNDPFWAYMFLKQKLIAYKPDVVLFTINSSDIFETVNRGGFERFGADGNTHFTRKAPWWEIAYAHSYLVRLVIHKVLGYNRFLIAGDWNEKAGDAFIALNDCVDKTNTFCAQNNIRCIFVLNPLLYEVEADTLDCNPVLQYARQKGYEVTDVHKYFKGHGVNAKNISVYYWPNDTHNTSMGYTLFAQAVATQVTGKQP